jgi:hypothetical protein
LITPVKVALPDATGVQGEEAVYVVQLVRSYRLTVTGQLSVLGPVSIRNRVAEAEVNVTVAPV